VEDDHILPVCLISRKQNFISTFSFSSIVNYGGKLYIFAGYNNVMGFHFNDIHEFNPLTSIWRRVGTHGIGNPVPRRRQCCLVINDRMYMFGGTSPVATSTFPNHLSQIQDTDGSRTQLYDQSDLYVFDFGKLTSIDFFFR
jgi:N-acetylneuraminic acid mutarotase